MIEIRKHGKLVTRRYLTGCKKCGCEFWFDRSDYIGQNQDSVAIQCPECGYVWTGKYIGDIAWVGQDIKEDANK